MYHTSKVVSTASKTKKTSFLSATKSSLSKKKKNVRVIDRRNTKKKQNKMRTKDGLIVFDIQCDDELDVPKAPHTNIKPLKQQKGKTMTMKTVQMSTPPRTNFKKSNSKESEKGRTS